MCKSGDAAEPVGGEANGLPLTDSFIDLDAFDGSVKEDAVGCGEGHARAPSSSSSA